MNNSLFIILIAVLMIACLFLGAIVLYPYNATPTEITATITHLDDDHHISVVSETYTGSVGLYDADYARVNAGDIITFSAVFQFVLPQNAKVIRIVRDGTEVFVSG